MGVRTRGLDIKVGAAKLKADRAARLEAEAEIDRWNRRLATGRDMLWSPTIRAALIAGTPWLDVFCPGCGDKPGRLICEQYSRAMLSARRRPRSPHPQIGDDFYGRREDQHAKGRLRRSLHRPLDQQAMGHSPYDDDHGEERMGDPPSSRAQSQSPAERSQKRDGEDRPHCDHTKGGERRR
jgi:hypothetical protein